MTHWHLAIETSGLTGSVALFNGDALSNSFNLSGPQRTAAALAPAIDDLLTKVRQQNGKIRLISVTSGPGSFTGLRIGVTTAKTLAYALQVKLVEVDALAVVARQVLTAHTDLNELLVGINAYRSQVYGRRQQRDDPAAARSELWTQSQWQQQVAAMPAGSAIVGNVAPNPATAAAGRGPRWIDDPALALPTAITTGILGAEADRRGQHVDPLRLVPRYLRPSAAEETWNARGL